MIDFILNTLHISVYIVSGLFWVASIFLVIYVILINGVIKKDQWGLYHKEVISLFEEHPDLTGKSRGWWIVFFLMCFTIITITSLSGEYFLAITTSWYMVLFYQATMTLENLYKYMLYKQQ